MNNIDSPAELTFSHSQHNSLVPVTLEHVYNLSNFILTITSMGRALTIIILAMALSVAPSLAAPIPLDTPQASTSQTAWRPPKPPISLFETRNRVSSHAISAVRVQGTARPRQASTNPETPQASKSCFGSACGALGGLFRKKAPPAVPALSNLRAPGQAPATGDAPATTGQEPATTGQSVSPTVPRVTRTDSSLNSRAVPDRRDIGDELQMFARRSEVPLIVDDLVPPHPRSS
jgi:hypothetical protein